MCTCDKFLFILKPLPAFFTYQFPFLRTLIKSSGTVKRKKSVSLKSVIRTFPPQYTVATLRARSILVYGQDSPPVAPKSEASAMASAEQNFLDGIIRVLLNSRRILSASYCIGYFIPKDKKDVNRAHETLQVGHVTVM